MSLEFVMFRLADGQHLNSVENGAGKTLLDKLVPKLKPKGANYIAFGEIISKGNFGVLIVGWGPADQNVGAGE